MNHWKRIIDDYEKLYWAFPYKKEILNLFSKYSSSASLIDFENGYLQTVDCLLGTVEATRRMYEDNTDEKIRLDLWSIHLQSITMLENVLLINSKKIPS